MDRTVRRLVHGLCGVLVLALAQGCGDGGGGGGGQDGGGPGTAAKAPPKPAARASAPKPAAGVPAPGAASQRLSADGSPTEEVRAAVRESLQASNRTLDLEDPRSGEALALLFDFIHARVELTGGGRYLVCTDFHTQGGTPYDVDYYVRGTEGKFVVEDVVLHRADRTAVLSDEKRAQLDRAS
jgi:hypothetical protein